MIQNRIFFADLAAALAEGWRLASATRALGIAYSLVFVLAGGVIIGALLATGRAPFVIAAAGAFMLVGPVLLAGFFGIARAFETGQPLRPGAIVAGFRDASPVLAVLALICGLLFMIFMTDAAILYAYMLGDTPVWLGNLLPVTAGVGSFIKWAGVSGFFVAFMLFAISAFSIPLLCERRAGLVMAVVVSVRTVFANFRVAMVWAFLLSAVIIGSVLLLPVLLLTLPWLAYAGRALYRRALPND